MKLAYLAIYYLLSINQFFATTINIGYNRKLSNLGKIYINKVKYSNCNDSFIFKLIIFYNIYFKANILFEAKIKAFFTMLKGLTLDYYYSNINTSDITINLDQFCNFIRNYCKIVRYKQNVFFK